MKIKGLSIVNSHPLLGRLNQRSLSRTIAGPACQRLRQINGPEAAWDFLSLLGLNLDLVIKGATPSAIFVNLEALAGQDRYFTPQVIFNLVDSLDFPREAILVNCLIPDLGSETEATAVLSYYHTIIETISNGLSAMPFACITGFKQKQPGNDLALRGFRFCFSSRPDTAYSRIMKILITSARFDDLKAEHLSGKPVDHNRSKELATELLDMKWVRTAEGVIGLSLLEDIKMMRAETTLVDLR
ncbi:MAG: hypothetical protein JW782_01330 [Candidatus Saganbacteria bacterium]|nr:hypothetical protein [Candidatus Saganbacteria bacterium]